MTRIFSKATALFLSFSFLSFSAPSAGLPSTCAVGPLPIVVADRLVQTLTPAQLDGLRDQLGLTKALSNSLESLEFHAIQYTTVDEVGNATTASGMVIFAAVWGASPRPVLSVQHGTTLQRVHVPSNPQYSETVLSSVVYAAHGFVTLMPDYLGMGAGPGLHPYLHAATEASASRDFILAARTYFETRHLPLSPELYLAGYSQGGHATMALHRLLESENIAVSASFPMAGPFDLSHTSMQSAMTHPTTSSSGYVADSILSMNRVFHTLTRLTDAFTPEVAAIVEGLFDEAHSLSYVDRRLPATPALMLNPKFLAEIIAGDRSNKTLQALEKNDVYDWTPHAPVFLFHASGDHDVPYHNSEIAYATFKARGVPVQLTDLGANLGHVSAVGSAYILSFKTLEKLHAAYQVAHP